jgi:hypothetical protein
MKKRKNITHEQYRDNHLALMKKRVSEEVSHGLELTSAMPILKALADSHELKNGISE